MRSHLELISGEIIEFTDVELFPESLVILAEVIGSQIGLDRGGLAYLGSPTWVLSGIITDMIVEKYDAARDSHRTEDIRWILSEAMKRAHWAFSLLMHEMDPYDLSTVSVIGPRIGIFSIFPDKQSLFGTKGNFAGVSGSRERKAKAALQEFEGRYTVWPGPCEIRFRNIVQEFSISKSQIAKVIIEL